MPAAMYVHPDHITESVDAIASLNIPAPYGHRACPYFSEPPDPGDFQAAQNMPFGNPE